MDLKQKATAESSNYDDTSSHPENKRQAIAYRDEGIKTSLKKELRGNLVNFLQSIGADNELPYDYKSQVQWLNHFHTQLAVNNPLWPEDMSFGHVYSHFVNAIMYNRVELRGHNIHAFITAFRDWITQSGVEENLREKWNRRHPDRAPKQLQDSVYTDDQHEAEINRLIDNKPVREWSDEVIEDQYQKVMSLYDQDLFRHLEGKAKAYANIITSEAKKRGLVTK